MKLLKGIRKIVLCLVAAWLLAIAPSQWSVQASTDALDVYFFHSDTCPHCAEQRPLMERIDAHNDDVDVHFVEVNRDRAAWEQFLSQHQLSTGAVPRTVVGDKQFVGYTNAVGPLEYNPVYDGYIGYRNQIVQAIAAAAGHEVLLAAAPDSASAGLSPGWVLGLPLLYLISGPLLRQQLRLPQRRRYWRGGLAAVCILSLFLFISLVPETAIRSVAQGLPFPLFVATLAIADGFNPCAFTVLVILLSLLTHTQRRRDMALIGGTFIATSAVMYFIFIMLMIAAGSLLLERYGAIFLGILGLLVAIAGLINIKDYFWFKQGPSLSLSDSQQRTISQKAGHIVRSLRDPSASRLRFVTALGGTVMLAVFVNVIELGCTAILPAVYMTTLINQCTSQSLGATSACYGTWTTLYALLYILPLLLILAGFIYSFESVRVSEQQGRVLKLVGGLFMLFFGLIMLFRPELLMFA